MRHLLLAGEQLPSQKTIHGLVPAKMGSGLLSGHVPSILAYVILPVHALLQLHPATDQVLLGRYLT